MALTQPRSFWSRLKVVDPALAAVIATSLSLGNMVIKTAPDFKGDIWRIQTVITYPLFVFLMTANMRTLIKHFPWTTSTIYLCALFPLSFLLS